MTTIKGRDWGMIHFRKDKKQKVVSKGFGDVARLMHSFQKGTDHILHLFHGSLGIDQSLAQGLSRVAQCFKRTPQDYVGTEKWLKVCRD